ncbi:MAG: dephospho-CoA kinase [Muribaculaceae bacterium]|nr:dephospho-CoA kinase [Muribaculaceae bacterium]
MKQIPRLIAITGGIGAGKSVVAAIVRAAGYAVYDCDQRAKELMTTSPAIKNALISKFGQDIYINDTINKALLSNIIFNDKEALQYVNNTVHPVVRGDIMKWAAQQEVLPVFVETALLQEGGIDSMVEQVWNITAPVETRIERVIKRNATTRDKVIERIKTQKEILDINGTVIIEIINDGTTPILPQVMKAIQSAKA